MLRHDGVIKGYIVPCVFGEVIISNEVAGGISPNKTASCQRHIEIQILGDGGFIELMRLPEVPKFGGLPVGLRL